MGLRGGGMRWWPGPGMTSQSLGVCRGLDFILRTAGRCGSSEGVRRRMDWGVGIPVPGERGLGQRYRLEGGEHGIGLPLGEVRSQDSSTLMGLSCMVEIIAEAPAVSSSGTEQPGWRGME